MRVCVITGASSGIGYATSKLFSERGYRVYGISRRSELRADVRNYGEIIDLLTPFYKIGGCSLCA